MEGTLVALGKLALAVAVAFPLVMYLAQDSLVFHPQPMAEERRAALARGANVESLFIEGQDGTRLHAWHLKGAAGAPLVMYFGGNAEQVSWMLEAAARRAPGTGWLLVDYRGYGASGGAPSEKALVADALRWFDHLKTGQKIYVFGRSLGSGVAVQLAAQRPVEGVVLVTPFDSLVEVGKHHYPIVPVSWMLRHRFDSVAVAPKINAPLLCIVAAQDEIIPPVHAKRLFDAWAGPKQWVGLDGAVHNGTDDAAAFWPSIRKFLTEKSS